MKNKLTQRLHEQICQVELIDTHEHLVNREMLKALGFNALYAIEVEYLKDDLLAMGMPESLILEKGSDPQVLLPELLPLLRQAENTTYYKALFQAFKDLHGLKGNRLDADALQSVSRSIASAYDRENWYGHIVREKCNIEYMLRDMAYMTTEDDFLKPVIRMDDHLMLRHRNLLKSWVDRAAPIYCPTTPEPEYRKTVRSLDDYLNLIDADFKSAMKFGAVAIKLGIAYERTLQFDKVSASEANKAFHLPDEKTTWNDIKLFQDYIVFVVIQNAIKYGLPIQIHTGILAGGKSILANSNPLLLSNLFLEFPDARFDVFHGGFPFVNEMGSLALMFPNVYLNTCWLPLISYASFQRALREWLCYVPAGKFLWGGDCHSVEGIYGSVYVMRQALAEVLAGTIEDGLLDEETALAVARSILHDNAARLFGL